MAIVTDPTAAPAAIPISELAASPPVSTLADSAKTAMSHLRGESLKNMDASAKLRDPVAKDPIAEARAALRPGPAESQRVTEAAQTMQTFQMLSQMTWRMVAFELGSASLQKTDKSIKMFIQAQ
ncbi:hypothetical protein [Tabrizicola aquatica]|uniref:hypothetical protein n=1 Tax=Tabrizicola aquatica TaxID=909926 RepID=UPI000CD1ED0D|nr:hypothetical protein [Tabrizicola aquatica]